jgi:hypothetical protein
MMEAFHYGQPVYEAFVEHMGQYKTHKKNSVRKPRGKISFGILKLTSKNQNVRQQSGFNWLCYGSSDGFLWAHEPL